MANLIGTGLGLRTRGLESGVDLPAADSVWADDTVAGDSGTFKPGTAECRISLSDADWSDKSTFNVGEDVYVTAIAKSIKALTDAEWTLTLWRLLPEWDSELVATLVDAQVKTLRADTTEYLGTGVGGTDDIVWTVDEPGSYQLVLDIYHANLPNDGGYVRSTCQFAGVDLPDVANVVPPDTVQGVEGTFDEVGRNEVPDLAKIPTEETGGPAPWLQLNVSREGTLDLDAVKLAYEAARNTALDAGDVRDGEPIRQFGVDGEGTLEVKDLTYAEEATRNTDPGAANVLREADGGPASYEILGDTKIPTLAAGGGGTPPGAPTWATVARTPADGKVTLHVVAAAAGDVIYARYRRLAPGTAWSAESETLKRTGTGDIEVPGTNGTAYQYAVYAKMGGLPSYWTRPVEAIPTDGSRAQIDLIMEAVAGEVNLLALQSKDTAGTAVDIAATVELPPLFDSVDTPCVKVFPDTEEGEPLRGSRNEIVYRVNVAFCQRSKTAAQKQEQFRVRQTLRDHFLGRRLSALPGVLCTDEAESGVLDMELLWERFQWVSVITLEFVSARDKG